jgi:hypothetical protein
MINPSDTILMDSLWENHSYTMVQNPVDLFMFLQDDSIPRLLETNVTINRKLDFYFRYPFKDSLKIELLNDSLAKDWYLMEYSRYKDTLSLWFTDFPNDTIELALSVDTLEVDTLQFVIKEEAKKEDKKKKRRRKKDKQDKKKKEKEVIKYVTNVKNSHDFFKAIRIDFETPLTYANMEYAQLIEDSIEVTPEYRFTDSLYRHLVIDYNWKEETKYELVIPPDALKDLFEIPNDSISLNFTTTGPDNYGNIALNIQLNSICEPPLLVQLVQGEADKEKIIKNYTLYSDSLLQINNIPEGDYYLKAIEDRNNDGRWNSGHYGQKLKAESVFFFHLPISVKAGWDIEDSWMLKLEDRKRPEEPKKKEEKE